MSRYVALRAILVVASVALPAQVHAQTSSEEGPIDEYNIDDLERLDLEELLAIPIVESASRREQSMHEAPSSITVITAREIAASGATNIVDILRRVPGLHVIQTGANSYSIGLRGITQLQNPRVLVLVNGRKINETFTGYVMWGALSIHPSDIDKIEIVRGPGSVVFGAGALSGVISITTKQPIQNPGFEAFMWGSVGGMSSYKGNDPSFHGINAGGGAHLAYNLADESNTLGTRVSLGLSHIPEWPEDGDRPLPEIKPYHYYARASLEYEPESGWDLRANLGHASADFIFFYESGTYNYAMKFSEQHLGLSLAKHAFLTDALNLRLVLDTTRMAADIKFIKEDYLDDATHPDAVETFEMVPYRAHAAVLVDLSLFDGRDILTAGGEATYYDVDRGIEGVKPQMVYGGVLLENQTRMLTDSSLILTVGGRFDYIQAEEKKHGVVKYRTPSYRGALIWHFSANQALRLSGASSYRIPTPNSLFLEAAVKSPREAVPDMYLLIGNPRLEPEKVVSAELGYQGVLRDRLKLNAVLFWQDATDLIGDPHNNAVPYQAANVRDLRQVGFELGALLTPTSSTVAYLNYGFTYGWDIESDEVVKDWPVHIVGLGAERRLPWHTRVNLDAYVTFDHRPTVPTLLSEGGFVRIVAREKRAAEQIYLNLRVGKFFADETLEMFIMGKNLVGFFRKSGQLRTYPSPHMSPIGGMVLLGVQATGL